MNFVLAVRDRVGAGSVVSALELGDELRRRGHHVLQDEGDFDQAWEGADAALCHADDPTRLSRLSRLHRVPLVLLARTQNEVAVLDARRFPILVVSSDAAFGPWAGRRVVVPPLAPVSYWAVCPHRDPSCSCPHTAVCRYENDPQADYVAPPTPTVSADEILLVGGRPRHGGGVVRELARRLSGRQFVFVEGLHTDALRRAYARARLLLMPAPQTAGRPAVEAGASHIPTIAAPSPGARELLGDAAIWANPERVGDWVATILRLDDPAEYRRRADAAYRRAASTTRRDAVGALERALADV